MDRVNGNYVNILSHIKNTCGLWVQVIMHFNHLNSFQWVPNTGLLIKQGSAKIHMAPEGFTVPVMTVVCFTRRAVLGGGLPWGSWNGKESMYSVHWGERESSGGGEGEFIVEESEGQEEEP